MAVANRSVHIAVDCVELNPVNISAYDFSNATSLTIVSNDDGTPAPIDLQWLSLSCDRYVLKEDSCEEIDNPNYLIATSAPPFAFDPS
ncbi:hypothetical protein NL387_26225, partial [Klebsiella pneumoniae]|nr:hypothetical protein [Klebsiella pneumoniae]